jgi:hypothetical protein
METPTGLAIKSLPVCTTNRHNDPRHSDTAPVETGTEQTLVRVARGRGLEHSPLARLPPELRTKIFEMAFIHPTGISLRACEVWNRPDDDELESAELEHGPPNPRGSMCEDLMGSQTHGYLPADSVRDQEQAAFVERHQRAWRRLPSSRSPATGHLTHHTAHQEHIIYSGHCH